MIRNHSVPLLFLLTAIVLSNVHAKQTPFQPVSRQVGCSQLCRQRRRGARQECRVFMRTGGFCVVRRCTFRPDNGPRRRGFVCRPRIAPQPTPGSSAMLPPASGPVGCTQICRVSQQEADGECVVRMRTGEFCEVEGCTLFNDNGFPVGSGFVCRPRMGPTGIGCTQICRPTEQQANNECAVRMSEGEFCEVEGCTLFNDGGAAVGMGFVCRPRIGPL